MWDTEKSFTDVLGQGRSGRARETEFTLRQVSVCAPIPSLKYSKGKSEVQKEQTQQHARLNDFGVRNFEANLLYNTLYTVSVENMMKKYHVRKK